jgi:hypothetical protein
VLTDKHMYAGAHSNTRVLLVELWQNMYNSAKEDRSLWRQ